MRTKIITLGLFCAGAILAATTRGGEREELMERMGFSKEEIARDQARRESTKKTLDVLAPKSDQQSGAIASKEAEEINRLRSSRQFRDQVEAHAQEAERRAADAEKRAEEAEEKYEAAKSGTRKLSVSNSIDATTYATALNIRESCSREAHKAREEANEEKRKAKEARQTANQIIAKTEAAETKLEKERLARIQSK